MVALRAGSLALRTLELEARAATHRASGAEGALLEGGAMAERVRVASLAEVPPGTGRQVQVSGRAVAIYNVDGTLHAIDGTCTHRGGPLGDGGLVGNVVTCPWHGARFDVTTGAVLGPPAPQGVISHRVTVEGDAIFVDVA